MIKVTLKDGAIKTFKDGSTYYEISKGFNLEDNILGAKVNNKIYSLSDIPKEDVEVSFIDVTDINGNKIYKNGLEFIFEVALKEVFPKLEITYQHSVPKGFLAEIVGDKILTKEDVLKIKSMVATIVQENKPINKLNVKKIEAIEYYMKTNQEEKAQNIQNISDKVVTLYELNGIYNYFYYDMPHRTGCITSYDIIYLGNNRLVFVIPNKYTKGLLPEYVHYEKIINTFLTRKNWLETQDIKYVSSINKKISDSKIKNFVKSCELAFNMNLAKVANEIINKRNVKFVLIAGPSSSGKTTTTKRLANYFRAQGFDPILLSTDDYFVEREDTPRDEFGNYDFECLHAIDLELFGNALKDLLDGKEISIPTFNFVTGKKEYNEKYAKLEKNSIVLIEGLHTLNDDLLPNIDKKYKYKIYLSPFMSLNFDRHNYVSTLDLRLIRRIIRDNRTRNYDINRTIHNWQMVRNGEENYIFPFINQADIIINTALPYEVGLLKIYAEPLLRSVDVFSDYYEEARRLLNFLKGFYPIPSEYVNKDSILREFIGGLDD